MEFVIFNNHVCKSFKHVLDRARVVGTHFHIWYARVLGEHLGFVLLYVRVLRVTVRAHQDRGDQFWGRTVRVQIVVPKKKFLIS